MLLIIIGQSSWGFDTINCYIIHDSNLGYFQLDVVVYWTIKKQKNQIVPGLAIF